MYEMKPEYYIGIDMIDEEHKQLFKYADEAYELLHDEFTPDKYDRIDIIHLGIYFPLFRLIQESSGTQGNIRLV